MIIGIVINNYKFKVFREHLKDNGFNFVKHQGPVPTTLLLKIETDSAERLQTVIKMANEVCFND